MTVAKLRERDLAWLVCVGYGFFRGDSTNYTALGVILG